MKKLSLSSLGLKSAPRKQTPESVYPYQAAMHIRKNREIYFLYKLIQVKQKCGALSQDCK